MGPSVKGDPLCRTCHVAEHSGSWAGTARLGLDPVSKCGGSGPYRGTSSGMFQRGSVGGGVVPAADAMVLVKQRVKRK